MIIISADVGCGVSEDWTEKYRPKSLDDVIGNPKAVGELKRWAESWTAGTPKFKAAVLLGPPGVGKTTSAEALANDMGWGIVEMNASDQRTGDVIRSVALRGAYAQTFGDDGSFLSSEQGKRKLIVLDEADSLFGNADRGAMPAINELIKETRQPVLLIVNDFYELSRKSSTVKTSTLQITFQRPQAASIAKALKNVAMSEGFTVTDDALRAIADNSNGDIRAAVRDLQSVALGRDNITFGDTSQLSNRVVRKSIYDLMFAVFRKSAPMEAKRMYMDVDEEPSYVLLWVDENLPYEYRTVGDLVRGYERLCRADIFLGRVHRRQYYGFWSYAGEMMTAGVASARTGSYVNRERFRFPGYMSKLSRSKGVRASKAQVCGRLADHLHTSTKRVASDVLPMLKEMLNSDPELRAHLVKDAKLEAEDLAFIMGVKADSKIVKDAMSAAAEIPSVKVDPAPSEPVRFEPPPVAKKEPKAPEPEKSQTEEEKPKTTLKSGQRSLFDF